MTGIFLYYRKNHHKWARNLRKHANKIKHRGNEQVKTVQNASFFGKFFINYAQRDNYEQFHTTTSQDGHLLLEVVDGSIHNMVSIMNWTTRSDYYPRFFLLNAYEKFGVDFFKKIQGSFAILLKSKSEIIIAKDPIGTNPMYLLNTRSEFVISSELKTLSGFIGTPQILEPGTVCIYNFLSDKVQVKPFININHFLRSSDSNKGNILNIKRRLFVLMEKAVKNAINVPCKVGALLSGGIDSTIICALAQKHIPQLDTYTVVTENSPDFPHAMDFTDMYPDTQTHVYKVSLEDLVRVVPDVIYHLETFDAALIRSALPMYYVSSKVEEEIGVLLTGEGGDELFGGYEYLKQLPNMELKRELVNLLKIEHATGLQRVDRIPYAFNLEARAPWFDLDVVRFAFSIPMQLKIHNTKTDLIEKWIIRETFKDIIPKSIFTRKKAKFSQGVGSQFFLRDYYGKKISDEEFDQNKEIFPSVFVKNKEELYYWRVFSSLFQPNKDFVKKIPRTAIWVK